MINWAVRKDGTWQPTHTPSPGMVYATYDFYLLIKYRYRIDIAIFWQYRIDIVSNSKNQYRCITSCKDDRQTHRIHTRPAAAAAAAATDDNSLNFIRVVSAVFAECSAWKCHLLFFSPSSRNYLQGRPKTVSCKRLAICSPKYRPIFRFFFTGVFCTKFQ